MTNMPDPEHFLVVEKRCPECLFLPTRVVSSARAKAIVRECVSKGTYFVCHRGSLAGNDQLCCRGFYDAHTTVTIALARHLGVVKFIPVPGNQQ